MSSGTMEWQDELLKTLMGFVPARRGRVVFAGADITREPRTREHGGTG